MLLSWLIDITIEHWEIWQRQQSNDKMIGWPSVERHNNAKVKFDSFDVMTRHWGMKQCRELNDKWLISDVWYVSGQLSSFNMILGWFQMVLNWFWVILSWFGVVWKYSTYVKILLNDR